MNNLSNDISQLATNVSRAIERTIPQKVRRERQQYFEDSLRKQVWDGKPRKDVKRRDSASKWYGFQYGDKAPRPIV